MLCYRLDHNNWSSMQLCDPNWIAMKMCGPSLCLLEPSDLTGAARIEDEQPLEVGFRTDPRIISYFKKRCRTAAELRQAVTGKGPKARSEVLRRASQRVALT